VIALIRKHLNYEPSFEEMFVELADPATRQQKPGRDTAMVMLHNGAHHTTIAVISPPATPLKA
jgi:hypothetical protein